MMSIDRTFRWSSLRWLLFFGLIGRPGTSGQSCQTNLTDYFYRVNSVGPFFDQSAYTKQISIGNLSGQIGASLFSFTVRPQTIDIRPTFPFDLAADHVFNVTSEMITVAPSRGDFAVLRTGNFSFDLVTTNGSYDYFVPFHRYLFNLTATQTVPNRPSLTSIAIVQIDLTNENVNLPRFRPNEPIFYISETAKIGTKFGTVYATDADNDTIRYSMANGPFSIDPLTGVLELQQVFHPGSPASYSIVVTICDACSSSVSPPPRNVNTTIRIFVTAVNKHSPRFIHPLCGSSLDFEENNTVGQVIANLVVSDDDRDDNGRITISFPSEESRTTISGYKNTAYSHFTINQTEQVNSIRYATIQANKTFYYEPGATRVWYLFILATDHGTPRRQSFCSFRVNLIDVNNNAPVFVMPFWNYTIYRSAFLNVARPRFLRIIAYDADAGENSMIDYHIATLKIPYLTIDRITGTIVWQNFVAGVSSLNASYFPITFEVYAEDRGRPVRRSERYANVTIYYDQSDVPPPARWLDPRYEELNISIHEKFYERYSNRNIFDARGTFDGSIMYQLASNVSALMTVQSPFTHDNDLPFRDAQLSRNGQIFSSGIVVTRGLHAELQQDYFLCITVLVRPPLIGSINIHLIDENDQSPMFDIRSIVLSVVEQETGYRSLAQIQAFDRDVHPDNSRVIYGLNEALTDSEAIERFAVAEDGTISTNRTFNGDTDRSFYRIFIRASNTEPAWKPETGSNTEDFQFDIQVISINTRPPVFTDPSPLDIEIDETTERGTNIRNLTITDPDIDTKSNFGILSGNFQNAFTFTFLSNNSDNSTRTGFEAVGQLVVVGPLSYEARPIYPLVLFVSDSHNTQLINVTVRLSPKNTKAPQFHRASDSLIYHFVVDELSDAPVLIGRCMEAIDPDDPSSRVDYAIYNTNHQFDLSSLYLNRSDDRVTVGIKLPGLYRDSPLGSPIYDFAIRATDEDGRGVSSYMPVRINVRDKNNNWPVPKTRWPIIPEGVPNATIQIEFVDSDDPLLNHTIPFEIQLISPASFFSRPTVTGSGIVELTYYGMLNRTLTKNLTVTFNATDFGGVSGTSELTIIVGDRQDQSPISAGYKTVEILYVKGFENSLKNIDLGSVFAENSDDWFLAANTYRIIDGSIFSISQGFLRTSANLSTGFYTVRVEVTKPIQPPSTAVSTISVQVIEMDSESARQAAVLRIEGEFPKTFIDPTLGNLKLRLRQALASILSVSVTKIVILAVRPVRSYRRLHVRPLTIDAAKKQALLDVFFYVPTQSQFEIERILNENLAVLRSRFGIMANISGPNPCEDYVCPKETICRSIRTIQPKPYAVDTNRTSFVGIDLLDAPFCVNDRYPLDVPCDPNYCRPSALNNSTLCSCTSVEIYQPLGRYCQVLGRVFDEGGGGYAQYSGQSFSILASAHFSFDFATRRPEVDSLILLYGRNSVPIDDFFWIAIEIQQSKLRFHFRGSTTPRLEPTLLARTSYHVQCQFVDSMVIISINDCQYQWFVNGTSNPQNSTSVQLYLGGLPTNNSLISALYPSLTNVNHFSGCIRNVLSNGVHLDMSRSISAEKSHLGPCPCELTSTCIAREALRASLVPWYIWLIMTLVFLLLATALALILLTCIRRKHRSKVLAGLYVDDTRDTIIDYKETAGEEDHSTYNLRVLRKPAFALTDDENRLSIFYQDRIDSFHHPRSSLGDYIDQQLNKYQISSYANDTSRRYQDEGPNSVGSDLSSIDSSSSGDEEVENLPTLLRSLGPKFSALADLYSDNQ